MDNHNNLRILVIGYGNGEVTFLTRLIKGLADSGVQITLASSGKKIPALADHPMIEHLIILPWKGNYFFRLVRMLLLFLRNFSFTRLGWLLSQVRAAGSFREGVLCINRYVPFLQSEWDVIYFPWNSVAIGYKGLFELGIPVVISCRGSQINIRPHLPSQKSYITDLIWTFQKATAVHCVSNSIQQKAQYYGLDIQKSIIIRPAVDPKVFKPPENFISNSRFKLITTGSLIWSKGYEYLLLAVREVIDIGLDTELHILGKGSLRQAILYTIFDLKLAKNVFLHDHVSPEMVLANLQSADIFVLSSLSEGISNAVLEAMSCRLPVVSTDCGGMSEAISSGVEGFLVPVREPHAIANAILRIAYDTNLRIHLGLEARARIIRDFNLNKQVDAFISLFRSITFK